MVVAETGRIPIIENWRFNFIFIMRTSFVLSIFKIQRQTVTIGILRKYKHHTCILNNSLKTTTPIAGQSRITFSLFPQEHENSYAIHISMSKLLQSYHFQQIKIANIFHRANPDSYCNRNMQLLEFPVNTPTKDMDSSVQDSAEMYQVFPIEIRPKLCTTYQYTPNAETREQII